jgi:hypothetical protein
MDEITRKIRAVKQSDSSSHYVWNRVYKMNEAMDTLLKMLPLSCLPTNS